VQGAFRRDPQLFEQMLSMHVGALPLTLLGNGGVLGLGLRALIGQGV
jgi:hypothetical protein